MDEENTSQMNLMNILKNDVFMQLFPMTKWNFWKEEHAHFKDNTCHVK
jgi:hypothetical protein